MVTLRILKLLEQNGFGTISVDTPVTEDGLYFENLPQDCTGVAIFSRGAEMGRGLRRSQAFDLYSRGENNVDGMRKLEQITELMIESFAVCTLPVIEDIDETEYASVSIVPVSNIENAGADENDRVLYSMTAQVTYSLKSEIV